jgi:hypothetical protein
MSLYRLVYYYSENRIEGSADAVDFNLRDILAAARGNNARLEITGALMFNAACFVQVLEGPRAEVDRLFARIRRDTRHAGVTLLAFEPLGQRAFGQWSMAFVGARDPEGRLKAFATESGFDPRHMSGQATFEFLHRLVLAQERAPAA